MPKAPRQPRAESARGSLPQPNNLQMYCRLEAVFNADPRFTLSFRRTEAKGWNFRCVCNSSFMARSSIVLHAKGCEDVGKVIAKALRAGNDIVYDFMTVAVTNVVGDYSLKSIENGQRDSAHVQPIQGAHSEKTKTSEATHNTDLAIVGSQAMMMQFERILTQTEEMRAEQRLRDRRMEVLFAQQLNGQLEFTREFGDGIKRDLQEAKQEREGIKRDLKDAKQERDGIKRGLQDAEQERDVMKQDIQDLYRKVDAIKHLARCTDAQTTDPQEDPATAEGDSNV